MEKNFEKLELAIGNIMENNDHPSFPKINSGLLDLDFPVISTSMQSLDRTATSKGGLPYQIGFTYLIKKPTMS